MKEQGRPGPGPSWLQMLGLPLPNKRPHRQRELAACWSPGRGPWGLGRDQLWASGGLTPLSPPSEVSLNLYVVFVDFYC